MIRMYLAAGTDLDRVGKTLCCCQELFEVMQRKEVKATDFQQTRTSATLYILLAVVSPSAVVRAELEKMWRYIAKRSLVRHPKIVAEYFSFAWLSFSSSKESPSAGGHCF